MPWKRKTAIVTVGDDGDQPNIRPLVGMLFALFRKSEIPSVLAARMAIALVIDNLYAIEQLNSMNELIRARVAVFDDLISCCETLLRRVRFLFLTFAATSILVFLIYLLSFFSWLHGS